jgi:hypothetical protein
MSRYKRNVGCRVDVDVEGPKKKQKTMDKKKQVMSPDQDEEEEGYMQKKVLHYQCGTCP